MARDIKIISGEGNTDAIAILPGEVVSYFNIQLPDLTTAKLEKIIPGVLSDYIAGNIDDIHFSIIEKFKDGGCLIAVCDKEWMVKAQRLAGQSGLMLKAIWPDFSLLDIPETNISIVRDNNFIMGRRADGTGFTVRAEVLEHVVGDEKINEIQTSTDVPSGFGMASGKFSPRPPLLIYFRAIKRLAIIMTAGLVLWLVQVGLTISQNEAGRVQYETTSVKIFKETFPTVKRIVNVEAQLRALTGSLTNEGNNGFLLFADQLFKIIHNTSGIQLESMSYDNTGPIANMLVTITSLDFSEVSTFENQLKSAGYLLEQGGSTQNGSKVFSDYIITEVVK